METVKYFDEKMVTDAKRQRLLTLAFFCAVAFVYAVASGIMIYIFCIQPYGSEVMLTIRWIHAILTALFVIFIFIFFGIKFKRINSFYKLVKGMRDGVKEVSKGSFFEYSETIEEKEFVDFKSLRFIEWNKYKKDYFERMVLVFKEFPFPEIPENAYVEYTTHANILVEYKILEIIEEENQTEKQK